MALVFVVTAGASLRSEVKSPVEYAAVEMAAAKEELLAIEATAAQIKYPIRFGAARELFGGERTLKWIWGVLKKGRSKEVFEIVTPHLRSKGYVVVFEGEDLTDPNMEVSRISVGYYTPLGRLYLADLRLATEVLNPDKKEPNQSAQTTPGS